MLNIESVQINNSLRKTATSIVLLLLISSCSSWDEPVDESKSKRYLNTNGSIYYIGAGALKGYKLHTKAANFSVLSSAIGKDKTTIFYKGMAQQQVDFATFHIHENLPKDKNHIYRQENIKLVPIVIKGVDVKSYQSLRSDTISYRWGKDKNNYFLNDKKVKVDYNSFSFLNSQFCLDKDSLYTHFDNSTLKAIINKPNGIKVINSQYVKNENNIYYVFACKDSISLNIEKFDTIHTLRVIQDDIIAVNDKIIYFGKLFQQQAYDIDTFEVISGGGLGAHQCAPNYYTKDKTNVYRNSAKIKAAKPNTFVKVTYDFAKDDRHVYYKGQILKGADPASFREDKKNATQWIDDKGNRFTDDGEKIHHNN